jgi:hypothetical protein
MKYKVCSKVECKDKLLVQKFDNLFNHVNKRKIKVARLGVQIRRLNFLKKSQHVKNKAIYVGVARKNVFHLVAKGMGITIGKRLFNLHMLCIC